MRFVKFIKSNFMYLIWFVLYYTFALVIFGFTPKGVSFVTVTYAVSITIALSPVGESILQFTEGLRKPCTEKETEYLHNIFYDVLESAKELYPNLPDGIQIYIVDAMYVNAFAIGRRSVAVTLGALETFTPDELKGVIGHELGHIYYGHTKALLLSNIGNILFSICVKITEKLLYICELIISLFSSNLVIFIIQMFVFMVRIYYYVLVLLFVHLSQIILSINSRVNEFEADDFADEIGYGEELRNSLYLLQKISMSYKPTFMEKMKSSHPHTSARISRLEQKDNMRYQTQYAQSLNQ